MPRAAIESSTATPSKYREPHARANGPWDEYELEDGGRTMERAEKIKANGKFVEHIAKHHQKKAAMHTKMAKHMMPHMKRGLVSEKAMGKAAAKRGRHHGDA